MATYLLQRRDIYRIQGLCTKPASPDAPTQGGQNECLPASDIKYSLEMNTPHHLLHGNGFGR